MSIFPLLQVCSLKHTDVFNGSSQPSALLWPTIFKLYEKKKKKAPEIWD